MIERLGLTGTQLSSAYWKCARATGCGPRKFSGLGAPAYIGTSNGIARTRALTKSPGVPSLESGAQAQAGRVVIPSASPVETGWRAPEKETCATSISPFVRVAIPRPTPSLSDYSCIDKITAYYIFHFMISDCLLYLEGSTTQPGGAAMSKMSLRKPSKEIGAPLLALAKQNISIRGPYETPKGKLVFILEGSIVTQDEIIELFEMGNLNTKGIADLKANLKEIHKTES